MKIQETLPVDNFQDDSDYQLWLEDQSILAQAEQAAAESIFASTVTYPF